MGLLTVGLGHRREMIIGRQRGGARRRRGMGGGVSTSTFSEKESKVYKTKLTDRANFRVVLRGKGKEFQPPTPPNTPARPWELFHTPACVSPTSSGHCLLNGKDDDKLAVLLGLSRCARVRLRRGGLKARIVFTLPYPSFCPST